MTPFASQFASSLVQPSSSASLRDPSTNNDKNKTKVKRKLIIILTSSRSGSTWLVNMFQAINKRTRNADLDLIRMFEILRTKSLDLKSMIHVMASSVSNVLANAGGEFHHYTNHKNSNANRRKPRNITVDIGEMKWAFRNWFRFNQELRRVLVDDNRTSDYPVSYHVVEYEDELLDRPKQIELAKRLVDNVLEIPREQVMGLEDGSLLDSLNLQKISELPLSEQVNNWEMLANRGFTSEDELLGDWETVFAGRLHDQWK